MSPRPTPQTAGAYVEHLVAQMLAKTPHAIDDLTRLRHHLLTD